MGIVTNGKTLILDMLFGLASATKVTAMGVGTDSTAFAVGQTQLNPSVSGSVLLQVFDGGFPTIAAQVVTCQCTYATGSANFTWNEIGLFNGTTNGTSVMLDRIAPIGPFTKSSAVSIVAVVTITQS